MKRTRTLVAGALLAVFLPGLSAPAAETGVVRRLTGVTATPSHPNADQPFRLRAEGSGRRRLWVRTKQLDPSIYGGSPLPSGSNPFGGLADLAAPPTATLTLPGDLPVMSLPTGHWAIGVSAREMLSEQNCKGEEIITVTVGHPPTIPIPLAPNAGARGSAAAEKSPNGGSAAAVKGGTPVAQIVGTGGSVPNASSIATQLTHRLISVSVIPASPKPDRPFRLRAEGNGNCRIWVRTKLLDPSPYGGPSFGSGGGISFAGLWDLAAPPTATLKLPGDLPPMSLATGHWAIGVSAREGFGGNCKGEEIVQVRVGAPPTIPIPKAPGKGDQASAVSTVSGGSTSALAGGGSSSSTSSSTGPGGGAGIGGSVPNAASVATQLTHRLTAVSMVPSPPKPDEPFRLRAEGNGNCKIWVRTKLLDPAPYGGPSFGTGGISFAGLWDLAAPPTATLNLPGDLPAMTLAKGHWAIGVSAREGFGGNCKGEEIVDARIGEAPPAVMLGKAPPANLNQVALPTPVKK